MSVCLSTRLLDSEEDCLIYLYLQLAKWLNDIWKYSEMCNDKLVNE